MTSCLRDSLQALRPVFALLLLPLLLLLTLLFFPVFLILTALFFLLLFLPLFLLLELLFLPLFFLRMFLLFELLFFPLLLLLTIERLSPDIDDQQDKNDRYNKKTPAKIVHQHFPHTVYLLISKSSTAILIATPSFTCSRMTLNLGSSASSDVISTSRMMGPGFITITSFFAIFSLS